VAGLATAATACGSAVACPANALAEQSRQASDSTSTWTGEATRYARRVPAVVTAVILLQAGGNTAGNKEIGKPGADLKWMAVGSRWPGVGQIARTRPGRREAPPTADQDAADQPVRRAA
jgi:hypothetical protein